MHQSMKGWMTLPVVATLALGRPALALAPQAGPSCSGTLLQFSVLEQGRTTVDHFRFSLALSGEGSSEQAALTQLNQRLARLRQSLQPFIQGRLVVPSPSTYPRPGRHGIKQAFAAHTGVSGEVKRQMYNQFIQAVGGQPGVRMQGMESIPNVQAEAALQQRLMAAALQRGKVEADSTAAAIGVARVQLLRIHRRDAISGPRRVQLSTAMRSGFDPAEAPEPTSTLRLELDYCLT